MGIVPVQRRAPSDLRRRHTEANTDMPPVHWPRGFAVRLPRYSSAPWTAGMRCVWPVGMEALLLHDVCSEVMHRRDLPYGLQVLEHLQQHSGQRQCLQRVSSPAAAFVRGDGNGPVPTVCVGRLVRRLRAGWLLRRSHRHNRRRLPQLPSEQGARHDAVRPEADSAQLQLGRHGQGSLHMVRWRLVSDEQRLLQNVVEERELRGLRWRCP